MNSDTSLIEAHRFDGIELSQMRRIISSAAEGSTNLALGELSYELPSSLKEEAIRLLQEHTPRYTPNAGLAQLRERIASLSPDTSFSQVLVSNGAQEALFLCLFATINPGDVVAVLDPDYPAYNSILKLLGAKVLRVCMSKDLRQIDWERSHDLLLNQAKALIFSSPNNPSGYFLKSKDLDFLEALCSKTSLMVIVDETYRGLCFAGSPETLVNRVQNLCLIGSLSKTHCMSGFRLGWAVTPKKLSDTLTKAKQYVSTCASSLAQSLAIFALGDLGKSAADKVFIQLLESRGAALTYLKPNWPQEAIHIPDATPYLLLKTDEDDLSLAQKLAKSKVITTPGSAFGNCCTGMLRINYALKPQILIPALETITNVLYPH